MRLLKISVQTQNKNFKILSWDSVRQYSKSVLMLTYLMLKNSLKEPHDILTLQMDNLIGREIKGPVQGHIASK